MQISEQEQIDRYYEALLNRDSSYVGIFYVGVKTTSVFCIASCRARKPKKENVIFYTEVKDALDNGFRPCKICHPTENAVPMPKDIQEGIRMVKDNPKEKISDQQLRDSGISPEKLRRWFKSTYGITFQKYQRMYRINEAFLELKSGKKTTHTAFDSGYESLSGFNYTYKKLMGANPSESSNGQRILISRIESPLGPMFVCATEKGICLLEFVDRKMLETEFKDLQRLLKARIIHGENAHIKQARKEVKEYFAGQRQTFGFPIDSPGTEFQQSVWGNLIQLPYGQTFSYQELAEKMGQPNSTRAVASANGNNRIAIVIPCHRIIGKDGNLRGYGGGLARKQWLLDHEKKYSV
ncbi:MAG: methylated-DNA--[protein]-cysteine S-methyltransferase [Bacteroidota bacterium]